MSAILSLAKQSGLNIAKLGSMKDTGDTMIPIFCGKTDVQSAFRLAPLSRASWKWLVFKAQDPSIGEWRYFVDKCLPFGASISCAIFQAFSDALKFLAEHRSRVQRLLGGLSLHLNHLIALGMTIYDWPFWTLPFGLFGSNLDTRDLETYPRTCSCHF